MAQERRADDAMTRASDAAAADRQMLVLVREAKGWTQRDLAAASAIHQSAISKYENGLVELRGANLRAVAAALGCPPELLTTPLPDPSLDAVSLHHRRRGSLMSVAATKKVEGLAQLTRISVEALLNASGSSPTVSLPTVVTDDEPIDSAAAAARIRTAAGVAPGPIHSLMEAVERLGVVVVQRPLGGTAQDAVSSWPFDPSRPPILVISTGLSGDRQRFTLAHELGHLLLHRLPSDTQEAEADAFAAALLAPAKDIHDDLEGLTTREIRRLVELKVKWGMSVAALVRRASDLELISERQYREFNVKLSRLGWRSSEPVTIAPERPRALADALEDQMRSGRTAGDLARIAMMTDEAFRAYFPVPDSTTLSRAEEQDPL